FDRHHVRRGLDRAEQRRIALRSGADRAQLPFGQHAAATAARDRLERRVERCAERARSRPPVLQQVKRHALRALRAHPGQGAQSVDQPGELRRVLHALQNGNFIPGGSCRPAVRLAIFSCTRASTLWTASFTAAAIKSSSISRSSPTTVGSICTRFTSCRPLIMTLTIPPPDSPVTSMLAISAWAFSMLACMAWACFIRSLKLPRMADVLLNLKVPRAGPYRPRLILRAGRSRAAASRRSAHADPARRDPPRARGAQSPTPAASPAAPLARAFPHPGPPSRTPSARARRNDGTAPARACLPARPCAPACCAGRAQGARRPPAGR